jgi:hypothetical protein
MSAIISAASIRPSPNCHHGSATYKKAIDLPTHLLDLAFADFELPADPVYTDSLK